MNPIYKYPRTPHLPQSPGATSDDKRLVDTRHLQGRLVSVSVKMDGENTTCLKHCFHARSLDGLHDETQAWMAAFHASFAYQLGEFERVCGENVYAKHSLHYQDLKSYFLGYSVWDETNTALSIEDTLIRFTELGITPVDELYRGVFTDNLVRDLAQAMDFTKQEGFVIRLCEPFPYDQFGQSVAKYVRKGHVQTDKHWRQQPLVKNLLSAK